MNEVGRGSIGCEERGIFEPWNVYTKTMQPTKQPSKRP